MTEDEAELRYDAMESRLTATLSERMLDLAAVAEGMRVLDVATGRGELALRAARRVGRSGHVLGIDISEPRLEAARAKMEHEGRAPAVVELRAADAETFVDGAGRFDVAIARWGLMYMQAPERALAAVRRALVPNGVLVAAMWAEPERLSWTLPRRVTARFVDLPRHSASGPGPSRYGTPRAIHADLEDAGFDIEHIEEAAVTVVEAATGAGIVDWARAVLSAYPAALAPAQVRPWEADLAREAEAFREGATIRLGGVTRLVVARPRRH